MKHFFADFSKHSDRVCRLKNEQPLTPPSTGQGVVKGTVRAAGSAVCSDATSYSVLCLNNKRNHKFLLFNSPDKLPNKKS